MLGNVGGTILNCLVQGILNCTNGGPRWFWLSNRKTYEGEGEGKGKREKDGGRERGRVVDGQWRRGSVHWFLYFIQNRVLEGSPFFSKVLSKISNPLIDFIKFFQNFKSLFYFEKIK